MRIAIVGGGITGLTAALKLSQKGHQVTIFEKEKYPGGLAAGFKKKGWDWHLEYFFHHLFTSDIAAKNLIAELGLTNKLFYLHPKTSIFYQGKISQFDSSLSLLKFPHLSFPQKIRTGIITAYLKLKTSPKIKLEKITAHHWLSKFYGEKPYQILWQPLLRSKFGPYANQISMSWFWARVKKRSSKLGYLGGGFQILIDKLAEKIKENGGEIRLNSGVENFNDLNHQSRFDRSIFTTPTSVFLKILKNTSDGGRLNVSEAMTPLRWRKLERLKMHGALNLILILKEKFLTDNTYWLNINESGFPFVAVVEHTNFVDPSHYGGNHILYVGGYYPQNHRYFGMKKEDILKKFLPYLQKINPGFTFLSLISYRLSANLFAQPIIPPNYSKIIPPHKTPIPNIFLANMQQIYPWDRGINYAVELGEKIANEIENS